VAKLEGICVELRNVIRLQQKELAMAYGKKMGSKAGFKPCKGCPTPAACKRKGKCMAKAKK